MNETYDPELVARPTVYKGKRMRSRLEATWAAFFDRHQMGWKYEPRAFASELGQYLPDFYVVGSEGGAYVEVKGVLPDAAAVRRRMEIIYHSDPNAQLLLVVGPPVDQAPVERWWWSARSWQRGWRAEWIPGRVSCEWEIQTDSALGIDNIDYELWIEGTYW